MTITKKDRDNLIKLLQEKKDIPEKYQDVLFPGEQIQKEYELTYAGKAREEDIIGDNLMVLKSLYENPEIKGKVKLIYIDPPFATKQDFMKDEEKAYQDRVVGSKFIEFTRKRIVLLRELLAEDGSIYIHLDQKKGHYIKIIADEVFVESNFRNEIIWKYTGSRAPENDFPNKHDVIYRYSKSGSCID